MYAEIFLKTGASPKELRRGLREGDNVFYVSKGTRLSDGRTYFKIGLENTDGALEIYARLAAMRAARNGNRHPAKGSEYQISITDGGTLITGPKYKFHKGRWIREKQS